MTDTPLVVDDSAENSNWLHKPKPETEGSED